MLWQSCSTCLRDDWSYGRSAVEIQPLNRQYLQHRLDGPGSMGQEGGEAKIASGWPPGFDAICRRSLNPGGSMSEHTAQASVSRHLAARTPVRRRYVPPSLPESVPQSLNQRWRERPRCPASRVTLGRRDGVVHVIVGRAACRCLRAHVVQDERAARVHVFVSKFAGTKLPTKPTEIGPRTFHGFSGRNVATLDPDFCCRTIAISMLAPCSASSMLFASLRPGRRPGLRALTTPARGTVMGTCAMAGVLVV